MESSQELFTLQYCSSEYDSESHSYKFNIEDFPNLIIPSPFQSDSSECETPTSPSIPTSRVVTPTTPLSPASSLGGVFSLINIASQTFDGATSSTPQASRGKKYAKKRSYSVKKDNKFLTLNM